MAKVKLFQLAALLVLVGMGLFESTSYAGDLVPGKREASATEIADRLAKVAKRLEALELALNNPLGGTSTQVPDSNAIATNLLALQDNSLDFAAITKAVQQRTLQAVKPRVYRMKPGASKLVQTGGPACLLPELMRLIHEVPEHRSLPQIVWQQDNGSGNEFIFPPFRPELLEGAFGGRTVALVGDSTSLDIAQWINRMVGEKGAAPRAMVAKMQEQSLSEATDALNAYHTANDRAAAVETSDISFSTSVISPAGDTLNGKIVFSGFHGSHRDKNCEFKTMIWPKVIEAQPDIVVANWGLELFYHKNIRPCNVRHWVNYEDWIGEVMDMAVASQARLLIFKNTNKICNKTVSDMEIAECKNLIGSWTAPNAELSDLDKKEALSYCTKGLMDDKASVTLNERLWRYLRQRVRTKTMPAEMIVTIMDDYGLQSCTYADGVHYHQLQLPTLRMLANTVQCFFYDKT